MSRLLIAGYTTEMFYTLICNYKSVRGFAKIKYWPMFLTAICVSVNETLIHNLELIYPHILYYPIYQELICLYIVV